MLNERNDKKLKYNIISSGIYQILVMIVPILTTPYVTRIFSASQMGDFNLSLTVASLFVVFSQFGIETYGSREIAKSETNNKRDTKFFNLLSIQFVVSIVMFILYNFIFIFIIDSNNNQLYFVQSLLILVNIFDISWYFIGIEEIRKTIARNTITKIFTTISIFVFIEDISQLSLYALINILGMVLGNLTMVVSSRKYINYKNRIFRVNRKYAKGSFKLLIPRLLNTSYGAIEKSILNFLTTASVIGIYSEGQKIINLAFSVINSGLNALMPRMSYHVSRNEWDKVRDYLKLGLKYSSFFSIIIVSGIFAVSTDFVDFFYGSGYEMVSIVLKITGLSLLFIPITALLTQGVLIPGGKDKEYSISIFIMLVIGTILNFILDPKIGFIGASLSYVGAQFLSMVYVMFIVREIINPFKIIGNFITSVISILINTFVINRISEFIVFSNPIISFMFFGVTSVVISGIIILFFLLINSTKRKTKISNLS